MKALALKRAPDLARPETASRPAPAAVLVQRHSTFGPGGSVAAPAIVDAGRPLDAATRTTMETGFGRDFSAIRVHDDARAHDDARNLGARAYAAGDHLVFGEGSYRPDAANGRALIAHELAHSVQQGGVQMKADGPIPAAADAELEAQADRAALDVTSGRRAPALSTIGRPAIFRAIDDPPAGGAAATPAATTPQKLPPGMTVIEDKPPGIGTDELIVNVTSFNLPVEKGLGDWVQKAYDEAAAGKRLVFSPLIEGGKVAAYKEGAEDYKSIWLGKFGFSTTQGLATAFRSAATTDEAVKTALADKGVAALITGMSGSLKQSGCDIDHIVEKQMGGTSIPSNLQLLNSKKNQDSGRQTYQELVGLVNAIRDPSMRGPSVRKLQLQLQAATVPPGTTDASFVVEDLLRKGAVKGSEEVKAKAEGKPVSLTAGGVGETARIQDTGRTPLDSMVKRIIPGMRLVTYVRGAAGPKSKIDKVEGELDSRAVSKTGAGTSTVNLTAEIPPAAPAPAAAPAGATDATVAAAPAPAQSGEVAAEARVLKLDKATKTAVAFYYPYLSPGTLTSVSINEKGELSGEGIIKPSVPFLGDLKIRYGPDLLEVVAPLDAAQLKSPIPGFRFTGGSLALSLSPTFVPKGTLNFEIGPKGKPVILGDLVAKYEAGAFIATGTLTPGMQLPGISAAKGSVEYHSEKGWSGKLEASSASIPNSTIDAVLGFTSDKGVFKPYATGGIRTTIKDADLALKIAWAGEGVSYSGGVTIKKPLPLVESVDLKGSYSNDTLLLTGTAAIKWKAIDSTMTVTYRRKDGEEGKFSGRAIIIIKTEKAGGSLDLNFNEKGSFWGKGEVSYQVTKDIRPKLGLELTETGRVKIIGEVAISDIRLTKMWPSDQGGKITFIKGAGVKFNIPTPVPGITAYGQIKVSAGLSYGVGPVMLKGILFIGELYPLEDDPQVKAKLKGKLEVPAYGEIYGTFGAYIGAEIALGAIGAKGGIEVTPALRIQGAGGIAVDADYDASGFSFAAEAYAQGQLIAKLKVDLMAELYAAWGLFSHVWTYNVAALEKPIGPELKITLGKVAYSKSGELTWPSPSQFKLEPENLDPLDIVKDLMGRGKAVEK